MKNALAIGALLAAVGGGAALLATNRAEPRTSCQTRNPDGTVTDLGPMTLQECLEAADKHHVAHSRRTP